MVGNILGELVLIGLTGFFAWLVWRAFKSQRPLVKWGGGLLAVIPTLLFGLISVVAGIGLVKLYVPLSKPVPAINVASTPDRIARGEQVAASEYYLRTAPFFETSSPRYAWLNKIVSVGVGERRPDSVVYEVFEIL